jgi:6-phosphogluconolactonase (cycloisomerase 2 family)
VTDLDDVRSLIRRDHGLAVVAVPRDDGTVGASVVNAGVLAHPVDGSQAVAFADNQTAACWVEITHGGKYLFTVNTASASLSRYAINRDGSLTLIHRLQQQHGRGQRPPVTGWLDAVRDRRQQPPRQHLRRRRWEPHRVVQLTRSRCRLAEPQPAA